MTLTNLGAVVDAVVRLNLEQVIRAIKITVKCKEGFKVTMVATLPRTAVTRMLLRTAGAFFWAAVRTLVDGSVGIPTAVRSRPRREAQ